MTRMYAHITKSDDDDGEAQTLAWVFPASKESVDTVLAADENSENGRSQWMWLRLPNGDLMLGLFPQGDTYLDLGKDSSYPDKSELEELMDKRLESAQDQHHDDNLVIMKHGWRSDDNQI